MIKLSHVCKSYHSHPVVDDISFTVEDGETVVLLGTSGSGKSTLLNMINHLVKLDSGQIDIDNKNIQDYSLIHLRRSIGYVFQQAGLFPHFTVADNIGIVLKLLKTPKAQRQQRVNELLELMHLEPEQYANRYPDELSGGQQQRVGVARALATNPNYLLMDEPFGALDAITRNTLQEEVIDLKNKLNKTIIFVTHDINEAFRLADRIAILNAGRLMQIGTPQEITQNPTTNFIKQLITSNQHG